MYMTCWERLRDSILFILLEWLQNGDLAEAYSYLNKMINMELFLVLTNNMARRKSHVLQFGKVCLSIKKMSQWVLWICNVFPKTMGSSALEVFKAGR